MYTKQNVDKRIQNTRRWTFEALSMLMEKKDFDAISVTELIEKAGISRATFYRNYTDKKEVITIKVTEFFNSFYDEMTTYYKKRRPLDERVLVYAFFTRIDKEEKIINTIIKADLEKLMIDGLLEIINYYHRKFYKLIKNIDSNETYIFQIIASSVWYLVANWHKEGKKESPKELARIYLYSIRSIYKALFEKRSIV
ncbi:MAG: TetR/AcrR family transcriptional regulator [Candidatus Izimaplasma sp.]|nr:TetR/AcrR family transcriptional regulator [Candidatus Izimaplasma bacterium]